ncbi:MAG: metal-sensitive transcriptional regulator [Candidatus Omnitrophica bacterium]|nr:metal-sensitive transcriptional regulator [Candidatus Omnitrophota bacterium]
MSKQKTTHSEQLVYLRKIEGQIRGIQKMIEEGRYCVDILTQIQSINGAIKRVENEIFRKHLEMCVAGAIESKSDAESRKKVDEVLDLIIRFKKG